MLGKRILSAAVAIAVLVPVLLWGGVGGVTILVAFFAVVALWELIRSLSGLSSGLVRGVAVVMGLALVLAFHVLPLQGVLGVVVSLPLLILAVHLVLFHRVENTVESASQMMLAFAYAVIPLSHAILLRRLDMGTAWVFFVLVVVCLGDAGAYFAGTRLGKHRLAPGISPGKTFEGLLGGIAGNFLGMLIMEAAVSGLPPLWGLVKLTLLLAAAGPLGDLIASALKRRLAIKDFGSLMPGHGGIMDRADSLIIAFPVVYYYLTLTGFATAR